jgi:hypothetical protein
VVDRQALEQRNPSRGCRLHQRLTRMASSHDGQDVPSAAGRWCRAAPHAPQCCLKGHGLTYVQCCVYRVHYFLHADPRSRPGEC